LKFRIAAGRHISARFRSVPRRCRDVRGFPLFSPARICRCF
jgi:hypothetical protein